MEKKFQGIILQESFSSEKEARARAMDIITHKLSDIAKISVTEKEEILLVIDEAVTNAMEHGNKWDPAKKIYIEISETQTSITVTVTDEGDGFTPPKNRITLGKEKILKPRGRGLYLMKQFCQPSWNKKGNSVNLKFTLKAC